MKLASLKSGGRDGTLVVVDRNLSQAVAVPDIAATMQAAIERWEQVAPALNAVYHKLNAGQQPGAIAFNVDALASPFPRSYQFLDGSVYLHHMEKARKARGAAMPANYKTEPLIYQGLSDGFIGPTEPMPMPSDSDDADYEAEVAIVFGNETSGLTNEQARRCQMLAHIPAHEGYSSLNLAAAVQVFAYELRMALLNPADLAALAQPGGVLDVPASLDEIEGLMRHCETALAEIGFYDPANPKRLVPRLRRLFSRSRLEREEVNILRGILNAATRAGSKP